MPDAKAKSLEYLCEVYKGLSPEHKEYVLDTALSLLKVQVGKNYLDNSKTVFPLDSSSAYVGEK